MIIVVTDNVGMWLPYYVLVGIVYFTFIELTFGRGLGKKLLGIYVTNIDFEYITFPKSLLQALSKSIPILNIADGIYAVFNPLTKQRLGNKWSDTLVIIGG